MLADMKEEARGKILRVLGVLSLLALLVSCATLRNAIQFQTPDIVLQEINITGLGLQGGTLDLVFDVYNPNKYSLRSTRLDVSLALAGTDFGEALIDKPLDFSPENHSRVVMQFDSRGREWAQPPGPCCRVKHCPMDLPGLCSWTHP